MASSGFSAGLGDLLAGFKLAFRPGIRLYTLLPLVVNFLLFAGGTLWLGDWFGDWINGLIAKLPEWLQFLKGLLWAIFVIAVVLFVFYGFTVIARLIAAPFNSLLAERVEKELRGFSSSAEESLVSMSIRALRRELVKLMYLLPRLLLLAIASLVLFFIPGFNALIPVLWFVYGGWMLSLEYLDYNADNAALPYKRTRRIASNQRRRALGLGMIIAAFTSLPLINLIIMPVAVCAGTRWWVMTVPASQAADPDQTSTHPPA